MSKERTLIMWLHKDASINKWLPNSSSSHIRSEQVMNMLVKQWEVNGSKGVDPRAEFKKIEITLKEVE